LNGLVLQVDVCGFRRPTLVLEWMGMHALMIFILATSNVLPVVMQGFYWKQPGNNIVIFPLLCSCNFFSTIAILQSDKLLISGSLG